MTDDDFNAFARAWNGAWELCGKSPTGNAVVLAFECLRRYELAEVTQALSRHALNPDTGQYPPKPADIVRVIAGGSEGRAAQAWTKVVDTARRVGGYSSVAFDDGIVQAVIADMGGWPQFCDTLQDPTAEKSNFPFVQRDFERRYRAYLQSPATLQYPKLLIGRCDATNARLEMAPKHIALIGDQAKARAILKSGTATDKAIAHDASSPVKTLLKSFAKA